MTTITAKVIADSISSSGKRLTTLEIKYPRWIHSEFMTHRVMSRNAASSRAIPVLNILKAIFSDQALPLHIGKNQSGMQAHEELSGIRRSLVKIILKSLMYISAAGAYTMYKVGAHKQVVNRVLEPYSHIVVCVTATEWDNFFGLRLHEDAEPHIRMLALAIKEAMDNSKPKLLKEDEWHIPYVKEDEKYTLDDKISLSVSRCASTSYTTVEGKEFSLDRAHSLYSKLTKSRPMHASPLEHQASPDSKDKKGNWLKPELHGNLVGWKQLRKMIPEENI